MSRGTDGLIEAKGVVFDASRLSEGARDYLKNKLRRVRGRERRHSGLVNRIFKRLIPAAWKRVEVEERVAGRKRVLVVGCAGGLEVLGLARDGARVVGIDIMPELLRVAVDLRAAAHPSAPAGAAFLAADGGALPFRDGAFDAVLSDNVVEHMPHPVLKRHLSEARRVLCDGGYYAFTTPNAVYEPVPDAEHVSLHTYAEWEALLREARFERIETPLRRDGPLGDLEWKKRREKNPASFAAQYQGVKMVTVIAGR